MYKNMKIQKYRHMEIQINMQKNTNVKNVKEYLRKVNIYI